MQAASTRTAPSRVRYAMLCWRLFGTRCRPTCSRAMQMYFSVRTRRVDVLLLVMILALWVLWSWCSKHTSVQGGLSALLCVIG